MTLPGASPAAGAAPPTDPAGVEPAGLAIPLSDDDASAWQARIDASKKAADAKKDEWKPFVSAYMVKSCQTTAAGDHQVVVPLVYAYTELKKSQLRFQIPSVHLKAKRPDYAAAVRAFEPALNHELKEAGADAMLDMCATDVLICGVAGVKVGYYADIRTRQVPVMQPGAPDPLTGLPGPEQPLVVPGPPDPATGAPTPKPITRAEQYIAHECYYGDRIAPENLLFPPEFTGRDYDKAAWLGHRFQLDLETAKRQYKLPADFAPSATKPQETLSSDEQPEGRDALATKDVEGVEIFYQAPVFAVAPKVTDPETGQRVADPTWEPPLVGQYRRLVFVKNQTAPVVHEDDTAQYVDEQDGKLKGRPGNALCILTLRYLPGSNYPVSDVQAGFPSCEELNIGRSQMINFRDRVMPVTAINRTMATVELKRLLDSGADVKIGKVVGVDGPPNEVIQPVAVAQFPRDNFKFDEIARSDVELAWSMGKNQAGLTEDGEPVTATEVQAASAATDTRLAYEQVQFLKWWCRYAEKFGALLQQFKDEPGYAEIIGDDGVKQLQAWNRQTIAGEFVFEARPDAALRLDINQERQQAAQLYTQIGNDPNVNRVELLRNLATLWNLDPDKIIVAQLPEKGPEPPRISWSFKGEDLSPVDPKTGAPNAAFPLVLSIAQQGGIQFPPEAIQNAMTLAQTLMQLGAMMPQPQVPGQPQTEHPGMMTPMPALNKQAGDRTTNGAPQAPEPSGIQ